MIGAEVARSLLLPAAGVHVGIGVLGIGYGLAGLLLIPAINREKLAPYLAALLGLAITVIVTTAWLRVLPLFYWENVGDLFTPWRPGEAGLCSLEYFKASKDALRSGGVFCQWLPMHQLTAAQFEIILATFQSVFPQAYLFRNHLKTANLPLGLVGFKDTTLDWTIVRRRCSEERHAGLLLDPLCRHSEGVALLYFGLMTSPASKRKLNTLANLRVELSAGRDLLVPRPGQYYSYEGDGNRWLDSKSPSS